MFSVNTLSPSELSSAGTPADLLDLLQESYGPAFEPNAGNIRRATRIITLHHHAGSLAAAAMLEGRRLFSFATSADPELGRRAKIGEQLLQACYDDGVAAWATIGESFPSSQALAQRTGMSRVSQPGVITALMGSLERQKDYSIEHQPDGLSIVSGPSSSRPGHRQQVWAWSDRLALVIGADLALLIDQSALITVE